MGIGGRIYTEMYKSLHCTERIFTIAPTWNQLCMISLHPEAILHNQNDGEQSLQLADISLADYLQRMEHIRMMCYNILDKRRANDRL